MFGRCRGGVRSDGNEIRDDPLGCCRVAAPHDSSVTPCHSGENVRQGASVGGATPGDPEELKLHDGLLREIARMQGASEEEMEEAERTPPIPPPLPGAS